MLVLTNYYIVLGKLPCV